ncbi:unnamed protein product [Cercopithifilaria johnstoni]|uniref:Uncharacterized protein n=1 Tax=Cercopithifilaria johnstoni TaxID=2874296 RepID=A0A8J2M9G8_9BILA|nr:unnamed protein product [Cercopithifilaria johnstoni]
MEPFGFAHLRVVETVNMAPTISGWKYKRNFLDVSKLTKFQQLSMRYLYYPVNTPVCHYQKRLILDSIYNNILIALPKELDTFFVGAIAMLNFHRWFPMQKVVCICKNVESSLNATKRFIEITGHSQSICVYANQKKSGRQPKWIEQDIIFATAESLVADFAGREELSEICLIIVEDAHRAMSGSHPLSELIRNCILEKGKFRVLAHTSCKVDKIGQLQLIVMNLQIDLIRSLSSIREEVSLAVASPRMYKLYIPISEDMRRVGNELLKAMEPIASLLCESGIFPTNDIKKIVNFSTSYLKKKVQKGRGHLAEIYCDFFELLSAYDVLMCDGLTAFRNTLEGRKKSIVIVLCRDRDPAFVNSLILSLKARLSDEEYGFAFFLFKRSDHQIQISENAMKKELCNVVIIPCDSDGAGINIGCVDSIICMDEGLCALRYTGTIRVQSEGNLSALCSAGYETNIYSFLTVDGTIDCVQADHIKGLQLCNDVLPMLPFNAMPEVVEYWAQNVSDSEGLLTMVQRFDFQERLSFSNPLHELNLIEDNCNLLNYCVKETFLWQDRLQRFTLFGHSNSAFNLTNIFNRDPEVLVGQVLRLQNRQRLKWMDEDSQTSKADDSELTELHLKDGENSKVECSEKRSGQKRLAKESSRKCGTTKVPRLNRIDSASFTLLKVFKTELKESDFVDHMKNEDLYRERLERITEIVQKLNNLIRL